MTAFKPLLSLFVLATLFSSALQAGNDEHKALNHFYVQFTEAFEHLDTDKLASVYDDNACYIPESQGKEITMGKENILDLYNKFFGKIKHKNARIEVDFRVIERQMELKNATDIGYYLIRFHPPVDAGEPVSEFSGKFVNVSKKNKMVNGSSPLIQVTALTRRFISMQSQHLTFITVANSVRYPLWKVPNQSESKASFMPLRSTATRATNTLHPLL